MPTIPARGARSQAWFPGRYVRLHHLAGIEVMPQHPQRHAGVQVSKTTIHGTARELRALAAQLLVAADRVDPAPANRRRSEAGPRLQAA